MPLFAYKAKDKTGKILEDVIQASNKVEASSIVKSNELQLLTLKSVDNKLSKSIGGKISVSDKASFCRFMATMLRAGMPLPEAIDIIRQETKNEKLRKILFDVSFQVRKGTSLSAVLSKHEKEFGVVFLTMIKAGEESGTLEKSFDHLSRQLLSAYELSQKVKGSMMYPIVILGAMVANAVVMMVFVLPKLSDVFLSLNVELPTVTRFVLGFGSSISANLTLTLVAFFMVILAVFLLFYFRTTRNLIMAFFVKLPVIKGIAREIDVARFARTLATLLRSGVPITEALDVSSDVIAQKKMRKEAKTFSLGVSEGESLSEILDRGKNIFPVTMVQTIKAGEKTGSLETVLDEMASFYEMEIDYSLKRATALLEPLLMLVIGIAVGAMVIIMITPIYSIVGGLEGNV